MTDQPKSTRFYFNADVPGGGETDADWKADAAANRRCDWTLLPPLLPVLVNDGDILHTIGDTWHIDPQGVCPEEALA